MTIATVRVSKLRDLVSFDPKPAELEACARAAPWCWGGSILASSPTWRFGVRRDVDASRLVAERAAELSIPWRHLLSVRVDLAADEGSGCDVPLEWLKRIPASQFADVARVWTAAGYELRIGYELASGVVQSSRDWITRAMGAKGRGNELAYYAVAEERDGQRILWLQAAGIDLAIPEARAYLAHRLRTHRLAARTVYATPTDLHVGIKSGQLDAAGAWRFLPTSDISGPCYLVGGLYELDELASYYREILDGAGFASCVTNESPRHLTRGALWGATVPSAIIGEATAP